MLRQHKFHPFPRLSHRTRSNEEFAQDDLKSLWRQRRIGQLKAIVQPRFPAPLLYEQQHLNHNFDDYRTKNGKFLCRVQTVLHPLAKANQVVRKTGNVAYAWTRHVIACFTGADTFVPVWNVPKSSKNVRSVGKMWATS
jgi:hypothetical protein